MPGLNEKGWGFLRMKLCISWLYGFHEDPSQGGVLVSSLSVITHKEKHLPIHAPYPPWPFLSRYLPSWPSLGNLVTIGDLHHEWIPQSLLYQLEGFLTLVHFPPLHPISSTHWRTFQLSGLQWPDLLNSDTFYLVVKFKLGCLCLT